MDDETRERLGRERMASCGEWEVRYQNFKNAVRFSRPEEPPVRLWSMPRWLFAIVHPLVYRRIRREEKARFG